jgi:hypothetical protein
VTPGITVRCVACHQKRLLSFEAAAALTDQPTCDRCFMPMIAEKASTKRTKGKRNAQKA